MADRWLYACVCTHLPPAEARDAIAAAAEQAKALEDAAAIVVASGLDEATTEAHERQAAELGAEVVSAPAGLSSARNAALARIPDDGVVAFLDHDALPRPDWLARLRARWLEAPADVACIGGAITPRYEASPPPWMGPGLWQEFSLLDRGPGLIEVRPENGQDVWGANVSFRAGDALAAGGFDPATGPSYGVPMFGEESDLQLRLRDRGARVLYAGDARVEHLIGPERLTLRSLWRRQLYRGFGFARSGRLGRARAAGRALKAMAGLPVALLRGNRELAAERWGRVALNVGAAASPALAWRLRRRGWPG